MLWPKDSLSVQETSSHWASGVLWAYYSQWLWNSMLFNGQPRTQARIEILILKQTRPIHGVHHYSNCAPNMHTKQVHQLPGRLCCRAKFQTKTRRLTEVEPVTIWLRTEAKKPWLWCLILKPESKAAFSRPKPKSQKAKRRHEQSIRSTIPLTSGPEGASHSVLNTLKFWTYLGLSQG
jgi:hypothetical protein